MLDNRNTYPDKSLIGSFKYAFEGVFYALRHNQNLRIHFFVGALVVIASIFFRVTVFEKAVLGVMILLVISAEMINTAIEQMVDLISTEQRKEAKIAKDVSAGMVLCTVISAMIVGFLIFFPHIFSF